MSVPSNLQVFVPISLVGSVYGVEWTVTSFLQDHAATHRNIRPSVTTYSAVQYNTIDTANTVI